MIKLTFMLSVALYVGFIVWGAPDSETAQMRALTTPVVQGSSDTSAETAQMLVSARGAEPLVSRSAIVVAPMPSTQGPRLVDEPALVSLVSPSAPAAAAERDAGSDLLRVTGSRVNMRAGPGTANAVVDSLPRGTLAEPLGAPIDGWQEIRDVESGLVGFMSARFLEPS